MSATHIAGAASAPTRLTLSAGRGNVLLPASPAPRGRLAGEYLFRGHRMRLETSGDGSVLFPTNVGVSLVTDPDSEERYVLLPPGTPCATLEHRQRLPATGRQRFNPATSLRQAYQRQGSQ